MRDEVTDLGNAQALPWDLHSSDNRAGDGRPAADAIEEIAPYLVRGGGRSVATSCGSGWLGALRDIARRIRKHGVGQPR